MTQATPTAPAPSEPAAPPAAPGTTQAALTAHFRRAAGAFWNARSWSSDDVTFANRGRRPSAVAVSHQAHGDHRLKVWLTHEHVGGRFTVNGVEVVLPHVRNGFHQGPVAPEALQRILTPPRPAGAGPAGPTYAGSQYDVCLETVFQAQEKSYQDWVGDPAACPEWMGVESITVTPATTGGGHHGLTLRVSAAGQAALTQAKLWTWRINGVWCQISPVSESNAQGMAEWRGLLMASCDPEALDVIRDYGEEDATTVLEDEHPPPRSLGPLRILYARGDIDRRTYGEWGRDVGQISTLLFALNGAQGQVDVYASNVRRRQNRINHLTQLIRSRFNRRASAYQDYTIEAWINEVGGQAAEWKSEIEVLEKSKAHNGERLESAQAAVDSSRASYHALMERIEGREEQYADAIAALYATDEDDEDE